MSSFRKFANGKEMKKAASYRWKTYNVHRTGGILKKPEQLRHCPSTSNNLNFEKNWNGNIDQAMKRSIMKTRTANAAPRTLHIVECLHLSTQNWSKHSKLQYNTWSSLYQLIGLVQRSSVKWILAKNLEWEYSR